MEFLGHDTEHYTLGDNRKFDWFAMVLDVLIYEPLQTWSFIVTPNIIDFIAYRDGTVPKEDRNYYVNEKWTFPAFLIGLPFFIPVHLIRLIVRLFNKDEGWWSWSIYGLTLEFSFMRPSEWEDFGGEIRKKEEV